MYLLGAQAFDSASRGPWGSINILWSHRASSLASLGALITVLALVFDPFIQQILSYPTRQAIATDHPTTATIKQAKSFIPDNDSPKIYSALYNGIWGSDFSIDPSCPSGNCTWPTFQSVGVCSQCGEESNVTVNCDLSSTINDIETDPPKCNVGLSQGQHSNTNVPPLYGERPRLQGYIPKEIVWTVNTVSWMIENETYLGIDYPLAVVADTQLGIHEEPDGRVNVTRPFQAENTTVCVLALCLKTYNISVHDGKVLINTTAPPNYGKTMMETIYQSWSPNSQSINQSLDVNTTEFTFHYQQFTTFSGMLDGSKKEVVYYDQKTQRISLTGDGPAELKGNFLRVRNTSLEEVMSNVAASLTKLSFDLSNDVVNGTVLVTEVYVSVAWIWLVLPALLLVLGIILISTICVNKGQTLPLWKSSILAAFFHGHINTEPDGHDCHTISGMETIAADTKVRLRLSESNGQLILESDR
ncbi:hypothetical protein BDV38DRAFT_283388 [Aspergillus pseudotamarii]|uniref:Uncharacterized protein n=1 Tax=Aspergillus pseudotamarii TaxID=132259 RepID=A0A5N6SSY6_ASPPS|nr:uncharacterized protein BDV38DRAFT_283388 [Aspergillus pseudotamarii]KAE8136997.1 hypothetical protein BDV38DRAFT_283388 [Aspergillus pseudotamarii]